MPEAHLGASGFRESTKCRGVFDESVARERHVRCIDEDSYSCCVRLPQDSTADVSYLLAVPSRDATVVGIGVFFFD